MNPDQIQPQIFGESKKRQWYMSRKYLSIAAGVVAVLAIIIVIMYFSIKPGLDSKAKDFNAKLDTYIAQLDPTSYATIKKTSTNVPKLEGASFAFISNDYQTAQKKYEIVAYNAGYTDELLKIAERQKMPVNQHFYFNYSNFYFDHYGANSVGYMPVGDSTDSKQFSEAKVKEFKAYAAASDTFTKALDGDVSKYKLNEPKIAQLQQEIKQYKTLVQDCATSIEKDPKNAIKIYDGCDGKETDKNRRIVMLYDYVVWYPDGLSGEKILASLTTHTKEQLANVNKLANKDAAKAYAVVDTRANIAHEILPQMVEDELYVQTTDAIRVLLEDMANYGSKDGILKGTNFPHNIANALATMTLFNNPKSPSESIGGFKQKLDRINQTYTSDDVLSETFDTRKKAAEGLQAPEYVAADMKKYRSYFDEIVADYKKSEEYSAAIRGKDGKTNIADSFEAYEKASDYRDKATALALKQQAMYDTIAKKLDDTKSINATLLKQIDILASDLLN